MKLAQLYKLYSQYFLVDTDTRKIRKNTMFFALKGGNFNGNEFAEEAIRKGALFSVVDDEKYVTSNRVILVEDVLKTLQNLANYHRVQLDIPIFALTGSNGKTTTKELINTVLNEKFRTTATVGNLNNHIGVPLTLLSMTPKTEIGIVEMGANHHKEIEFLCSLTEPDYGYITNFGKAHLEGFGSLQGVIEAKSELYDYLKKNNKIVFVNPKDAIQVKRTKDISSVIFDKSIRLSEVNPFVNLLYKNTKIQSNLIGEYNFNNISAAITIGEYFKVSEEKIKTAIESYVPINNRSQIINKGSLKIILDAYNANPTSMKAAIESFNLLASENKTVILGDMFELGNSSLEEHQLIVNIINTLNFKNIFLVGENFYNTKTNSYKFKNYNALKTHIINCNLKDSYILIKGSRGMALERILEFIN